VSIVSQDVEPPPVEGDPPPGEAAGRPVAGPAPDAAPGPSASLRGPEDFRRILRLEVPVIVRLAERTLPLSQIVNLTCGAIIEFDKTADSPLDLMINNKCIGQGMAVKTEENFGLRVSSMGSVRERVEALGGT
jgi:flagellar motor switch protein FliN